MNQRSKPCERCGDGTIIVKYHTEYQGESPQGGYVQFTDEVTTSCTCWTDDELYDMYIDDYFVEDYDEDNYNSYYE